MFMLFFMRKARCLAGFSKCLAEGEGFEPPLPVKAKRFSRPPVSTTHTSLRVAELTILGPVYRLRRDCLTGIDLPQSFERGKGSFFES